MFANNGTAKSTLGLISTYGEIIFSKVKRKNHRAASLVNKVDWGAVPQFLFPGNPGPVYTCGHLH